MNLNFVPLIPPLAGAEERMVNQGASRDEWRNTRAGLFNLTIDSKLRACDLVKLRVEDLWSGSSIRNRAHIKPPEQPLAQPESLGQEAGRTCVHILW
jgi:hypothetical protein